MRAVSPPLFAGLLAFALIAPAHAAGVSLTWSRCFGEGVGTQNRAFACDTNSGTEVLVASFVLPADVQQVSGNEIVIDLISQVDPMPAWWDMKNAGTCRAASLLFNTVANSNDVVCIDWAQAQSQGGIGAYDASLGSIDPSLANAHRKLKIALAVPLAGVQDLVADTEYFTCNIVIDHRKTIGTGACGGCTTPVCLVLNGVKVTTVAGAGDLTIGTAAVPGSNIATWQGAGANCFLVPVRKKTWGEVKALYR